MADGASCRPDPASCQLHLDPYSSLPGTSGPHWQTPANWGVYSTPQNESQLIHNLEHGGIVIWYDPERVDAAGVATLSDFVQSQVSSGISGRFKFILSPWAGLTLSPRPLWPQPGAICSSLDTTDTSAINDFARRTTRSCRSPTAGPRRRVTRLLSNRPCHGAGPSSPRA